MLKNKRETESPEAKNVSDQRHQVAELIGRLLAKYLLKRQSIEPQIPNLLIQKSPRLFSESE